MKIEIATDRFSQRILDVPVCHAAPTPAPPFDIPDHWPKNVRWYTPQQLEAVRTHAPSRNSLVNHTSHGMKRKHIGLE